jgi:hypothetical protein
MGRPTKLYVVLTDEERQQLEAWQRATTVPAGLVRRARIVLMRADGESISQISRVVGMRRRFVEKWIKRFRAEGPAGLHDKPGRGRKPFFRSGRGPSRRPSGLPATAAGRTELVPMG